MKSPQLSSRGLNMLRHIPKVFKHPLFIFAITIGGAAIGFLQPDLAINLNLLGSIYLNLLKFCIGPIVLSCVALGIFDLLSQRSSWWFIIRLIGFLVVGIAACAAIATAIGLIAAPGKSMSEDTLRSLGVILNANIVDFSLNLNGVNTIPPPEPIFQTLLHQLIPDNAIAPLVANETLKLIVVSGILGVGMAFIPRDKAENLRSLLISLRLTFNKILLLLTYILPFALFSIVSYTVATVDGEIFLGLLTFIIATIAGFFLISALSIGLIILRSKEKFSLTLSSLLQVSVVALATQSVMATLPQALNSLSEDVKASNNEVNISLPLIMTLGRFGNVAYFAIATILAVFIYNKTLGLSLVLVAILLNIFSGIATAGAVGIATLTMLGITLEVLQIPTETMVTLLIIIDPIIAPVRVLLTVLVSMVVAAWAAPLDSEVKHPEPLLDTVLT
ncbi:MAG: cation:dicarboxylase symporter family transporter [Cyanobacteria bacterium P01_E01_bin.42]